MATADYFLFGFAEFRASAVATLFRVTGMAPLLAPLLDACPSNSLMAEYPAQMEALSRVRSTRARPTTPTTEGIAARAERRHTGPDATAAPDLSVLPAAAIEVRTMRQDG